MAFPFQNTEYSNYPDKAYPIVMKYKGKYLPKDSEHEGVKYLASHVSPQRMIDSWNHQCPNHWVYTLLEVLDLSRDQLSLTF